MALFRELLKTMKRKFYWDKTLERLFQESKRVIVGKIEKGVQTFEMNRATGLATNYSKIGISYFLFQKHYRCSGELNMGCGHGHWKIILTGSRFTSDSESRYAPVEGEAVTWSYLPLTSIKRVAKEAAIFHHSLTMAVANIYHGDHGLTQRQTG